MNVFKAFLAGFLATLIFHQGAFGLLYLAGVVPSPPYNMAAVGPLQVPQILSLAFWGGIWGIALWLLLRRLSGAAYWATAVVFGAVAPTAIALLVVFPLKGMAIGWDPKFIIGGLLLNGIWGLGVGLLLRLFKTR